MVGGYQIIDLSNAEYVGANTSVLRMPAPKGYRFSGKPIILHNYRNPDVPDGVDILLPLGASDTAYGIFLISNGIYRVSVTLDVGDIIVNTNTMNIGG